MLFGHKIKKYFIGMLVYKQRTINGKIVPIVQYG